MPIRALLMDIDDTLFDFQTGYKRALRAALAAEPWLRDYCLYRLSLIHI